MPRCVGCSPRHSPAIPGLMKLQLRKMEVQPRRMLVHPRSMHVQLHPPCLRPRKMCLRLRPPSLQSRMIRVQLQIWPLQLQLQIHGFPWISKRLWVPRFACTNEVHALAIAALACAPAARVSERAALASADAGHAVVKFDAEDVASAAKV